MIADELILSFVPKGEQRTWRNMTRMKTQLTRDRVRLQSQMECLLEEMRIKLCSVVSDKMASLWRIPSHYSGKPSRITAFSKNLVVEEWVWSARPKTLACAASLP